MVYTQMKWGVLLLMVAVGCSQPPAEPAKDSRVDQLLADVAEAKRAAEAATKRADRIEREQAAELKALSDRLARFEANLTKQVAEWQKGLEQESQQDEDEQGFIELGRLEANDLREALRVGLKLRKGEDVSVAELNRMASLAPSFMARERRQAYLTRGREAVENASARK